MSEIPQFPSVADLSDIPGLLSTWAGNFKNQTSSAFTKLTPKDWIRLIIVIGAYLLARPYLVKAGAKFQQKQFEKAQQQEREEYAARKGKPLSANDLRGGKKVKMPIPGVDSSDDDSSEGEGAYSHREENEWGRKARIRQRKIIRKAMEEHERKLHEKATESDKEIEDLLED